MTTLENATNPLNPHNLFHPWSRLPTEVKVMILEEVVVPQLRQAFIMPTSENAANPLNPHNLFHPWPRLLSEIKRQVLEGSRDILSSTPIRNEIGWPRHNDGREVASASI
jgi:hypothetical protein